MAEIDDEYVPATQFVHVAAEVADHEPAMQLRHAVEPTVDHEPALHARHTAAKLAPTVVEY